MRRAAYVPLALTLFRFVAAPFLVLIYLYPDLFYLSLMGQAIALLVLLFLVDFFDFLDGHLSRRWNVVTTLGKILDPCADSVCRMSVFFAFTQGPLQLPLLLVLCCFYRDMLSLVLRMIALYLREEPCARRSGKVKTMFYSVVSGSIALLLFFHALSLLSLSFVQEASWLLIILGALGAVVSGGEYLMAYWPVLKKAAQEEFGNGPRNKEDSGFSKDNH